MIAVPEIARMLSSSDEVLGDFGESRNYIVIARTQYPSKICLKRISKTLSMSLRKLEAHFLKTTKYYTHYFTKNIMDTSANKFVYVARTFGAEPYSSQKEGGFVHGSKSIYETIKRNKLSLYENTNTVVISKTQKK